MGRCTVSLLGGFEVRIDGSPVPVDAWRSRRAADLVKLLAVQSTHQLHREQVMDLLWPELGMEAAGANLRKAVHYARRAMGAEEAILSTGGMLSLWGADVDVDARRFLAAADAALATGDEKACALAADLFTGEAIPADRYEAWADEPRARLRARYLAVLKGARRWQRVLEVDPTDEESHRELMRQYYEEGRRREAIRQFERLRDALRESIGVGPDPDTIALYVRILDLEGEEPPSPAERAAVLIANGLVHMNRGDFGEAEHLAREAKSMAIDAGLGHELGDAATLLALVSSWTGRWYEVFREEFTASLAYKPELAMATYDANVCFAEYYVSGTDGPEGATAYARELLNLAQEAGSAPGHGLAQLMLGEALLYSGDYEGARVELQRAFDLGNGAEFACLCSLALERLAEVELALGDRVAAGALLQGARPLAAGSSLRSHLLVRLLGIGVQVPSEAPAALAAVAQGERLLADTTRVCDPCSINFRLQAASASARAGDLVRARRHLGDAERVSGMWQGGPWSAAVWETRARVRLAEGEPSMAVAFLREAAAGFAQARRPVDEARCRAAAGAL
jgi:DNA-binding SARP family transcriptional activator